MTKRSIEERLIELMSKGYDIHIECKGVGRVYEMSYEARLLQSANDGLGFMTTKSHAVGDTLEELLDNLEKNFFITDE